MLGTTMTAPLTGSGAHPQISATREESDGKLEFTGRA
jgi:hypothetical protein